MKRLTAKEWILIILTVTSLISAVNQYLAAQNIRLLIDRVNRLEQSK